MERSAQPHVVFLPFPLQGHVKPMLTLAKLMYLSGGFHVTFVNSEHNHRRLLLNPATESFLSRHPYFHLASIPDGLPQDHPRVHPMASDLLTSMPLVMKPKFRELLEGLCSSPVEGRWTRPKPTCVVVDGTMIFGMEMAEEVGIPTVILRTFSALATWMFFHFHKLTEEGEIPVKGEDMDMPITCIPGLETVLRRHDLPDDLSSLEPDHLIIKSIIRENLAIMSQATALILDTFDELEGPFISKIKSIIPKTYSIGPLHALLKSRAAGDSLPLDFSTSLWNEDRSCMAWLDSKPPNSVVFVSFGSLAALPKSQLLELWHGLMNSGKPFLWTVRPDLVDGIRISIGELEQAAKERVLIVGWIPQEEVLAHPAVGCFLTHSGWNSTLESIFTGTPTIGCPLIFDQPMNSLCMSRVWGTGVALKGGGFDRVGVEKIVRVVMDNKREQIMESVDRMAKNARESVEVGGSSWCNLDRLIDDIRSM